MASARAWIFRNQFSVVALLVQLTFLILFGVFVDYSSLGLPPHELRNETSEANNSSPMADEDKSAADLHAKEAKSSILQSYAAFQDIHTMIFIGFGLLMAFLKRYSFSSIGLNMLVASLVLQWATLTGGWILHFDDGLIRVDMMTLIGSDFATAAVLISFGAVLGRASPVQLILMAVIEIVVFQFNELIVFYVLKAADTGDSMVVHAFGAYFGLSVSFVLGCPDEETTKRKQRSVYHSDVFAMIGTVFLWLFWPSFNSVTAVDEGQYRAVINTYYALAASAVVTFAISGIIGRSKFDMVHIQNSTLAGGVAVGTMADMIIGPWGAILTGSLAAIVSVLGYRFLTPLLSKKLKIHDTCGVQNLHGIPGIMSALGAMIPSAFATKAIYGSNLYKLFPEMANGRTAHHQAAFQLAALVVSLAMAVAGGLVTGVLLRLPIWNQPRNDEVFDDQFLWELPTDSTSSLMDDNNRKRNPDTENDEQLRVFKASFVDA